MVLNENTNIQNQSNFNKCLQDNRSYTQETQKFSKIFYQFTHKIDNSSHKIVDFYDNYMLQKLELAEKHIEQPRIRVQPNITQVHPKEQIREQLLDLKRIKVPHDEKSTQKLFDDNFLNGQRNDILDLDLDFIEVYEQSSLKKSNKMQTQLEQQQTNQKKQFQSQNQLNGKENAIDFKEQTNFNQMKNNDKQNLKENQQQIKDDVLLKQDKSISKIKNNNMLNVQNADTSRKSLIGQFSEIKISDKKKIQCENNLIQEQIDKIKIEDFYTKPINKPIQTIIKNGNQNQQYQQQDQQKLYLKPQKSSFSSDENYSDELSLGFQQQQQIDEFFINNQISSQNQEDNNDEDTNEYEITDYSSNESSNLGSPVLTYVNKDEIYNDRIISNNQQSQYQNNNIINIYQQNSNQRNIPPNNLIQSEYNSQNSNSDQNNNKQECLSQQTNNIDQQMFSEDFSSSQTLNKNNTISQLYELNFSKQNSQQENMYQTQFIPNNQNGNENSNNSNMNQYLSHQNKKLLLSPQKLKTVKQRKILYCNNKEVPNWAQNLQEVAKQARQQTDRRVDPTKIFGLFSVEELNLTDIFDKTGKRYDQCRGSSANWKQDHTPDQIEHLISTTSQTPNKNQKMLSKLKQMILNPIDSIKKNIFQ